MVKIGVKSLMVNQKRVRLEENKKMEELLRKRREAPMEEHNMIGLRKDKSKNKKVN